MQKNIEKKEDPAAAPVISQKEYLQKYLMKDKGIKVKKKKKPKISSSSHLKRSVIIDDDIDLNSLANVNEEAFNLDYMGDEAPQICGYSDDRPIEEQLKEKFSTGNWKSIGEMEAEEEAKRVEEERKKDEDDKWGKRKVEDLSPPRKKPVKRDKGRSGGDDSNSSKTIYVRGSDSDLSPPRKTDRKKKKDDGKKKKGDSPKNKRPKNAGNDSDLSPPRKRSRQRQGSDSDLSPPRKSHHSVERSRAFKSDERRRRNDVSPPRRSDSGKHGRRRRSTDRRTERKRSDSDSDMSPPRRSNGRSDERRSGGRSDKASRVDGNDSDLSPPRKSHKKTDDKSEKLDKTLDGKVAGLQNAKRLKEELRALKEKENKMFKKLDASVLGKSAAPVMRDRKTGQKRDLEKEKQAEKEKLEKESLRKNKYDLWGRGLKQVRDREEQMADTLHEMSKPLARYKDDEDLDRYLKSREREGDPMLEYIRNKQDESHVVDLTVDGVRRKYRGSFMPNRFDIPPGHRWDGVDRSNGYEQKWFESKSAKVAVQEEAWKWSSVDM